ncbi:MAG: hypothetical protein WC635_01035 [Bacteriovorax sp.]|jgi:hypothetical protein
MKHFALALLMALSSFAAYSTEVQDLDHKKINGPECIRYLNKKLHIKFSESYQICSMKSEDLKVCLIKNSKKSKNEKATNCFKK